jgi:hypothetical protein
MQPCIHRGSQRREGCCGGKKISRWICRERKTASGDSMDCVLTERESIAHKQAAPSAFHATWDEMVAICEKCPLYTLK